MNYQFSKLAIGLAVVCTFSGQASANNSFSDFNNVNVTDSFVNSVVDNGDGTFGSVFSGKLTATNVSDTFLFSLTPSQAGTIVLGASTTSKNLTGLSFTLTDTNTSQTWYSAAPFKQNGSTFASLNANPSLVASDIYSLNINGGDGEGKGTYAGTFTITPVPEPTEGALLLSGIGLLGFIAARRKNAA